MGRANSLYHNNHDGTFTNVADSAGVVEKRFRRITSSRSCAWGDYDNDGFIDLFVTSGNCYPDPTNCVPQSQLPLPQRGRRHLHEGHGRPRGQRLRDPRSGVPAGATTTTTVSSTCFVSQGVVRGRLRRPTCSTTTTATRNAWLNVKLIGTRSNRSAIGAKVRVQRLLSRRESLAAARGLRRRQRIQPAEPERRVRSRRRDHHRHGARRMALRRRDRSCTTWRRDSS